MISIRACSAFPIVFRECYSGAPVLPALVLSVDAADQLEVRMLGRTSKGGNHTTCGLQADEIDCPFAGRRRGRSGRKRTAR